MEQSPAAAARSNRNACGNPSLQPHPLACQQWLPADVGRQVFEAKTRFDETRSVTEKTKQWFLTPLCRRGRCEFARGSEP